MEMLLMAMAVTNCVILKLVLPVLGHLQYAKQLVEIVEKLVLKLVMMEMLLVVMDAHYYAK